MEFRNTCVQFSETLMNRVCNVSSKNDINRVNIYIIL